MTVTPITDDAQWRALRAKHIGGSEIGTLFDVSPYVTKFTLWHMKAGKIAEPDFGNDRTEWGKRLEPAIAAGLAEDMRWTLKKNREYCSHDRVPGMGCTVDYDVIDHADGPGIVEIKFVAEYATWKANWSDTRGPAYMELQLQHQLACHGRAWGSLAVFIGQTATLVHYERKRNEKVIGEIERRVGAFWDSVRADVAPDPVGTQDEWAALRELHPVIKQRTTIEIPDSRVSDVCQMFLYGHAQRRSGEDIEKANKVLLLHALGEADCAMVPKFIIRQRPHGKGRVITVTEEETGIQHTALTPDIDLA